MFKNRTKLLILIPLFFCINCGCAGESGLQKTAIKVADQSVYIDQIEGEDKFLEGCSWYCAGSVDSIISSPILIETDSQNYSANNAHDFDLKTAWIENTTDTENEKYLQYVLDMSDSKNTRLGITTIILANGFGQSQKDWKNYSRVKKLKMFLNGTAYAELNLLDIKDLQTIDIGKIMLSPGSRTVIKFNVLEIYKGDKFPNAAISELVFDGVGAH